MKIRKSLVERSWNMMVKPEIGLSMLYCLGGSFRSTTANITKAEATLIELVDDGFQALSKRRASMLREMGRSYGLKYSVHAPFSDINIASLSKPMLKATMKRMEQSMAHANLLDAYLWIFHPGTETGISMFYPNQSWLQNLKTTRFLLKIASEYGMRIAIENVPEPYPFLMKSVEDFARFYAEVNEDIGLVLDIGHANINAQIERFLTTFRGQIVHMHLSDNNGKSDQHLGIGDGTIQWEKVTDLIGKMRYDKALIVESIEHVHESVQELEQLFA